MKPTKTASIGLTLVGLVFLVPQVLRTINGEPLSFTPGLAAAIGLFLGAIVNLVLIRKSGGHSGPPGA
jgi:hypothetical protein